MSRSACRFVVLLHLAIGSDALKRQTGAGKRGSLRAGQGDSRKDIKLFCMSWITNRHRELHVLPDMKQQLAKCDGYALYGPMDINDTDIVKVHQAPSHPVGRDMAHLIPVWSQVLHRGDLEKYDWIVNIEYDHILRPAVARKTIAKYYRALQNGTQEDQANLDKAMMFMWGNAFLFNRKMVKQMKTQWPFLAKTRKTDDYDNGCPEWYWLGRPTGPPQPKVVGTPSNADTKCPQDEGYPRMVSVMTPQVAAYGRNGCNQMGRTKKGDLLPMGCANMQVGGDHGTEATQFQQITNMSQHTAVMPLQLPEPIEAHLDEVPILHRVYSPKVHALARTLLPTTY